MPHELKMIENLLAEKSELEHRRDVILDQVDMERGEMKDEYPNPVIEDLLAELQTLVDNIFQLENTVRLLKETYKKGAKKVGCEINIGDYVILFNKSSKKHFFIASDKSYVNPSLGIISSNSPMAQQMLSRKFGEKLALMVNGTKSEYKLLPL